jgi:hypothetical protein
MSDKLQLVVSDRCGARDYLEGRWGNHDKLKLIGHWRHISLVVKNFGRKNKGYASL